MPSTHMYIIWWPDGHTSVVSSDENVAGAKAVQEVVPAGQLREAVAVVEAAEALEWHALDYAEGADAIVSRESWMRLRRALANYRGR